jgi:hypothetical protein
MCVFSFYVRNFAAACVFYSGTLRLLAFFHQLNWRFLAGRALLPLLLLLPELCCHCCRRRLCVQLLELLLLSLACVVT